MPEMSREQALECAAFVEALEQTSNVSLAAAAVGMHRTTFIKRKRLYPAFATRWDAALVAAQAALKLGGGSRPPIGKALRTSGGEATVAKGRNGKLQIRRALPGRITREAEQEFLRALAASANIRLSAAATGFSWSAFYARKLMSPTFAIEMQQALAVGHDRLEMALIQSAVHGLGGGEDSAWRDAAIEDNPIPPMTVEQAMQLLHYHRKTVRLGAACRDRRLRREPDIETVKKDIHRKVAAIKRERNYRETGEWRLPHETSRPGVIPLPPFVIPAKAGTQPAHAEPDEKGRSVSAPASSFSISVERS
mgnify:CR=1 FL=1